MKQINLSVVTSNVSAKRLYERYGFEAYGIERNALEVSGRGYDEAHMTYFYNKVQMNQSNTKAGGVRL